MSNWLTGWRRNALAFTLGIAATLSLPPFFVFPLMIVAYGGLFYLLEQTANSKRAFADGFFWGWGFYVSGLYWFCVALLTDPEKFAWMIPFALCGLTAVIALYQAVFGWIFYRLPRGNRSLRILLFATLWTLVEYARGHWFSGFPWNLAGYAFAVSDASLQLASIFGAYGLTWLGVWLAVLPVMLWDKRCDRRVALCGVMAGYCLLAAGVGWGAWRLTAHPTEYVDTVKLRLVQANIQQHHKWNPKLQMAGLQEHINLTQSPGIETITHIIWPETAVPYVVSPGSGITRLLASVIPPKGALITGALRSAPRQSGGVDIWNSIVVFDRHGALVNYYDKSRLVPFGEFLPFRSYIPEAWTTPVGPDDFARGPGGQILRLPGAPDASPLICYEVIFPELSISRGDASQWFLNVTNDAWFGQSSGPYQHFQMARTRAVENGLPLIRVANTGISAIIDGYGRIIAYLALGKQGVLDGALPKPATDLSLYSKIENFFPYLLIFLVFGLTFRLQVVSRRNNG